jgi:UDP-glucose 4-epimerase
MRLLVTGAAGFLGKNALLALPPSWEVVALHRAPGDALDAFCSAHGLAQVRTLACDLTDAAQVDAAMDAADTTFDACLYLASNTSIPGSLADPAADLRSNVLGLLHTLERWRFGHLVYLSSGAVYNGLPGLVGPEARVAPTLPYAISKLAAEHYVASYAHYRGTPARATIIRFFGAYGPYEPARKLYSGLVRRFAFARNPEFTVLGNGANYIDAMYVDDAMRALFAVLDQPPASGVETVDLGVGSRETINQMVVRAAHAFGLEPRILHQGEAAEYITFYVDPERFAARYGVRPEVPLDEGLRRLEAHLRRDGGNG